MMNKLFSFIAILTVIFSFQSCKEDIELTGDFKETPVIYGLLDQADSIHMIKITRAFIGPGDALTFAQIPDSNYFNSVAGTVTEFINGVPARVFTLKDTLITNKDPNGIFYAPTQKLYYFSTSTSTPLLDNAEYRLNLDINNGAFAVSGKTELVKNMTEDVTPKSQPFRFILSNGDFITTFVKVNTGTSYQVSTKLTVEFTEWRGADSTVISFDWKLGESDVNPGSTVSFSAKGETFYNLIVSNATNDPAITKRTFNSITTTVVGGSEDLYNYILVNEPSTSLAQSKPTYTNLTSTNGHSAIGLFTARQTLTAFKPFIGLTNSNRCININTTRELCLGPITSSLLFCSDNPADILQTWYCP